jgi:hypothetical protein
VEPHELDSIIRHLVAIAAHQDRINERQEAAHQELRLLGQQQQLTN